MSKIETKTGHAAGTEATTGAAKPEKSSRARKSAAHSRTNSKAASPDHAKPARAKGKRVSRADLVQMDWDRWLVVVDEQDLMATAKLAMVALASTGRIFFMAGGPVKLTHKSRYIAPEIHVLDHDGLTKALSKVVGCVGYDHDTGNLKPGPSPAQLAKLIQTYRPYDELPMLTTIVVGPAYRPDGTSITESGYDEASGIYCANVDFDPALYQQPGSTGDAELDDLLAALG